MNNHAKFGEDSLMCAQSVRFAAYINVCMVHQRPIQKVSSFNIYEYFGKESKKKHKLGKASPNGSSSQQDENTPLHVALVTEKLKHDSNYSVGEFEQNCGLTSTNSAFRRPTDSTYSSMSTCSHEEAAPTLSVHSEGQEIEEPPSRNGSLTVNYGQITLTVCFTIAEAQVEGQLLICIIEAQDLPPREYNGACDPYIIVSIYKSKGRKNKSKKHIALQKYTTTIMKKTQHPIYKETFMLEISKSELKDCCIKLETFDCDRYANDTELSEVKLVLKDLDIQENEEPQVLTVDLCEPKVDYGEILFGMSYLPTAERLSFNIAKTSNLKVSVPDLELFCNTLCKNPPLSQWKNHQEEENDGKARQPITFIRRDE
ncbi:Synaptotagmin-C [Nymphon striatum]|nr:Synaptotagmin-C [Nymphon striatum]